MRAGIMTTFAGFMFGKASRNIGRYAGINTFVAALEKVYKIHLIDTRKAPR